MPRAPRGAVIERPRADGLTSFCLRFSAYGTRRFETLGTDEDGWTPARAAAELRKVLALVEAGVWRPDEERSVARDLDPDVTFGVYAAEWVRRWRGGEFGDPPDEATVKDYVDWRLDKHLLPFFSSTPIVGIDRRLCARFKAHKIAEREEIAAALHAGADLRDMRGMRLRPLSNRSISMFCGLLGQILEQAVADELIAANPARGQHMKLASTKAARTFLELDELADLLDTASALDGGESATTARVRGLKGSGKPPPQIAEELGIAVSTVYYHLGKPARPVGGARRAVVAGLGYAGLRISELCALERRSLRLHVGRLDVEDAKTPTGIREVDLTPVLRDELVVHRAWMASAGFDVAARARVYQSGSGRPLTPSNVRRMLRVLRRQTNARREARALNPLPHITPHTLRRTYISVLLLASGGDVEYVMSQVGHADAETTMRIYSQLLKRAKRDHGRAFDSLVAEARETVLGSHGEPTEASEKTGGPAPNWHTNWHKSPKRGPDAALAVWSEAAISMD